MDSYIVSFCIATYQRYEIVKELIMELLSVDSDKFEVVVCDNCSKDGSFEKIKEIKDVRLQIYANDRNIGSLANMCAALDRGRGHYLFYINDRDNVDSFKIKKLITILERIDKEDVAFAKCIDDFSPERDYDIFLCGREALLEFGCRIAHPTGYLYRYDAWNSIVKRRNLFEQQCYGDYPFTQICAILSQAYNGAIIYGDICNLKRRRIDFSKVKSGYYSNRKDKRLWYTPEVQWRELMIAYKFLIMEGIDKEQVDEVLSSRYQEYLRRVVIEYKNIIAKPENTLHYNLELSNDMFLTRVKSIRNGLFLWRKMISFCTNMKKKDLLKRTNYDTKQIIMLYLTDYGR